jgi:glutamate-5-semialdehyde dehydrogenase
MSYTQYFEDAQQAGRSLSLSPDTINTVLADLATEAISNTEYLLTENQKDLDRMDQKSKLRQA